jgi:colicin import membrane protein
MKAEKHFFMKTVYTKPFLFSVVLHVAAFSLLLFSFDFSREPTPVPSFDGNIIDAVTVDDTIIEEEISRIREQEQQQADRQRELEERLNELQDQASEAEKQRQAEEQRLADIRRRQQEEETLRKEEEQRLAEARRQQEELKRQQEEEERQRREEEERKAEEARLAEEERKRLEAEEALSQQLAEEQRLQQEEQDRQDLNVINSYVGRIADAIEREFNTAGLPPGLSCIFQIRMIPGGDVADARVIKSSGNTVFDSRAEIAVKRASPLPVPDNPRIFAKMREIRLTFAPN